MKKLRVFVATLTAGLVCACAAPAPRMQELETNSYMVTVRAQETPDGKKLARRVARKEADAYCEAKGQFARPTHLTGGVSDYMQGGDVEMNFRCQDVPFNEHY